MCIPPNWGNYHDGSGYERGFDTMQSFGQPTGFQSRQRQSPTTQNNYNANQFHFEIFNENHNSSQTASGDTMLQQKALEPQPYIGHPVHLGQPNFGEFSAQGNVLQPPFDYDQRPIYIEDYTPLNTDFASMGFSSQANMPTPSPSVYSLSSSSTALPNLAGYKESLTRLLTAFAPLKIEETGVGNYQSNSNIILVGCD